MLNHGGVAPDFAIAAEGTDFGVNWVACGYTNYRITLHGEAVFTPMLEHAVDSRQHPNPIVRLSAAIEVVQAWARDYERRHRYKGAGGTAIPKVQIGAVRGGNARSLGAGSELCSIYLEVNTTPAQRIGDVDRSLKAAFRSAGLERVEITPYVMRPGFEADVDAVEPLRAALDQAHAAVRGVPIPISAPLYASMWRDHNVFNMNRVPAVTMGPKRWQPSIEDLVQCARIYALTAIGLCGQH